MLKNVKESLNSIMQSFAQYEQDNGVFFNFEVTLIACSLALTLTLTFFFTGMFERILTKHGLMPI